MIRYLEDFEPGQKFGSDQLSVEAARHANDSMAGHYASADVGRLLKQANLLLNRSGTQTVLRVGDSSRQRARTIVRIPQQEGGRPGFARQVHESRCGAWDRLITRSTTVPRQTGRPGFRCQVF
jgi:hypothetical protein